MKTFFKHYFFLLDHETKKQLPILFLIFFLSSFLDVVGIGLVMVFLNLIVNFESIVHNLTPTLYHIANHFSKNDLIFFIGIGLILAFIFKGFWSVYSQRKLVGCTSQFSVRFKTRLMVGYQNADYAFHLKQNSAYLINKISLVDTFSNGVFSASLNIMLSILVIIGVISYLLIAHPLATFFLILMVGLIFTVYEFFIKKNVIKMGKIIAISGGEINKSVIQALGGLKEIRVLGKEPFFLEKMASSTQNYSRALATYNALQLIPRYMIESIAAIFLVTLILGALLVGMSPISILPTLGIFAWACIRLLPTVIQLIGQFGQLRSAGYATGLLYKELTELEGQYRIILSNDYKQDRHVFFQCSLRNVSFLYANAKSNALDSVNLTFIRGQSIGLIGASGAGKSTLVNIILRLLVPDAGEILVDGLPIKNLRAWLNNFAYIPQSIFLLDDTLKHNIAMGEKDSEIDDYKLHQAIVMAQLSDVISDLPDGVNTLIGENGVRLSGGQRQRVALARSFYYEREIIIMDEATSSLDNETENEVINSIKRLHGLKTLIVIAHRLSTIQHCDIIYELAKGRIISHGSFQEVIENKNITSTT